MPQSTPTISQAAGHGQHGPRGPRLLLVAAIIIGTFVASHITRNHIRQGNKIPTTTHQKDRHQRIVALSPSIVEIIYELGIQDQLVGVSRYAYHPPEAKHKPDVGGYLDLNYEKLLTLHPDCVILLEEQSQVAEKLEGLGIDTIIVNHNHTRGIINSIRMIGYELGHGKKAQQVVNEIEFMLDKTTSSHRNTPSSPRVLICISRDTSSSHPDRVIIAGNAGYHRELVEMLGAKNAYQGPISFPSLSREKLINLNPDVIIDLVNSETWNKLGKERLLSPWRAFSMLSAVRNQRVVIIHGDEHLIPGPRFPKTLEQFAHAIHP